MVTAEMSIQRKNTKAFIETAPVCVTLIPRERAKQPTGGVKWAELAPREKQTLRLIEPPSPALPVRTVDGIQRQVNFILLGEWDAELGVYDIFDLDGHKWEVVQLIHDNGWERRAEVARYG
jgi:hypothetical protein